MPACDDMVLNGGESDVDCGGSTTCPRCPDYRRCTAGTDCTAGSCTMGFCGDTGCMPFPGTSTDTFGYFGCTIPLTPTTLPCPDISSTGTAVPLSDDGQVTALFDNGGRRSIYKLPVAHPERGLFLSDHFAHSSFLSGNVNYTGGSMSKEPLSL